MNLYLKKEREIIKDSYKGHSKEEIYFILETQLIYMQISLTAQGYDDYINHKLITNKEIISRYASGE